MKVEYVIHVFAKPLEGDMRKKEINREREGEREREREIVRERERAREKRGDKNLLPKSETFV